MAPPSDRDHVLGRLANYVTILLVDDSTSLQGLWSGKMRALDLWAETIRALAALTSRRSPLGPTMRFHIDFVNSENGIRDTSDIGVFPEKARGGTSSVHRCLSSYIDQFTLALMALSHTERQDCPGLSVFVLSNRLSEEPFAGLRELSVETANGLSMLGLPSNEVGVQFVQVGNDRSTSQYFGRMRYEIA